MQKQKNAAKLHIKIQNAKSIFKNNAEKVVTGNK